MTDAAVRGRGRKVAFLSPLPPARTGVAHYSSMVLPALQREVSVSAFDTGAAYRADEFDVAIYQLGNNPHHEWIYHEALRRPGIAVLHDLVLHHLIVEATLARNDSRGYITTLERNHGAMGAAWALGRVNGLHDEIGNFLLPASVEVANRSTAVIVHNLYARDRLLSFGVSSPIFVVPHPWIPAAREDGAAVRTRYSIAPGARVIGLFGFLTSAKRGKVVLEAFREARKRNPSLTLLIVGEPAPDIDVPALGGPGVIVTGYVADAEFPALYAAADRLVNLRYPSAGESSGTLIRALDAGKPVAVSAYAQFAEFPDDCVRRIPLGEGEVEQLAAFFLDDLPDPSAAQRRWLEANASLGATVDGYLNALEATPTRSAGTAVQPVLALFPQLSLVRIESESIVLRNRGEATIRTRTWGQPEYRLIVRFHLGDGTTQDRWVALPGDLLPGMEMAVPVGLIAGSTRLELHHALQGIPVVPEAPWAAAELPDVR